MTCTCVPFGLGDNTLEGSDSSRNNPESTGKGLVNGCNTCTNVPSKSLCGIRLKLDPLLPLEILKSLLGCASSAAIKCHTYLLHTKCNIIIIPLSKCTAVSAEMTSFFIIIALTYTLRADFRPSIPHCT